MIHYLMVILLLSLLPANIAFAQQAEESVNRPSSALYVDYSSLIPFLGGNVSGNVETKIFDGLFIRFGAGYGYAFGATSSGFLTMVNWVPSESNHHFECGAGVSIVQIRGSELFLGRRIDDRTSPVQPAFLLGYRYHPYSGGLLFRIGIGSTFVFGAPFYISIGHTL